MHKRRALLESLRTKLQTLNYGAFIQRIPPARAGYPCITLAADSETVETLTVNLPARPQDRALIVAVKAWIRGTPDDEKAESDMDAVALEIEGVMTRPTGADDILLIATDFQVAEDEPEIHVVTLTYRLSYSSTEFSPA
jgi:hypothetical protein